MTGNEVADTLGNDDATSVDRQTSTRIIPPTFDRINKVCHQKRMANILVISEPSEKQAKENKTRNISREVFIQ